MSAFFKKIVIGMSLSDDIPSWTFVHYMKPEVRKAMSQTPVLLNIGNWIQNNRNLIVHQAFNEPIRWDYLLFLDDDILWPIKLLDHIKQYEDPIVAGLYVKRSVLKPQLNQYIAKPNGNGFTSLSQEEIDRMVQNPSLYKIDATGMGCTAIRRDVLEKLAENNEPWFDVKTGIDGQVISEDIWFCMKATQAGFQIFADSNILCEHIGYYSFTLKHEEEYKAKIRKW